MSAPKHTPGPWKVDGWEVYTADGREGIAEAFGGEAQFANARLIAAAPELFEALKGLSAAVDGNRGHETWAQLAAQARDAITKAEGAR